MNIEENKKLWSEYSWEKHGEEWSRYWGSTETLWKFTIFPRIQPLLLAVPNGPILEIACGHGRMTEWLLKEPRSYMGVDLTKECVDYCRKRFGENDSIRFHQCNGRSLEMAASGTVAFAFSWGSLVHCNDRTMEAYAKELDRVLVEGGYAVLHHSNLRPLFGTYPTVANPRNTPRLRDPTVNASWFTRFCHTETKLQVRLQEKVGWGEDGFVDCITILGKGGRRGYSEIERDFMEEARVVSTMAKTVQHYTEIVE